MNTTKKLLTQLMVFEGLRLQAYVDAAGVPTIGYGHTYNVRMGDRISAWYARDLLKDDIAYFEAKVKQLDVARTEGQLDALVSFAFNLGIGRLKKSTLLKCIRQQEPADVIMKEWRRWNKAGGKVLAGLVTRRQWEMLRFFQASPYLKIYNETA
jgi:lysozyme